ncbi:MAG TPA: hypothetical protein ENI94_00805 [Gammaproteobacteria bacterium]|nr:hypothetical protein [Gammaproteobacteria bacterium]
MPALFALSLLTACGDEGRLDFQTVDSGLPLPLIEVYMPLDGSTIPANSDFVVDYAVVRGKGGDYVEIRVDQQKPMRVNSLKGRHQMKGLNPGRYALLIVEYAADGKKTGGMARIEISVE